jgi:hypothetical protein
MASEYTRDQHPLTQEPGATNQAGPTDKVVKVPRDTFRRSVGHGSAGGGSQKVGGETGDPTIRYVNALTWAQPLPRTGKFSTADQKGKTPITYYYDPADFGLEY